MELGKYLFQPRIVKLLIQEFGQKTTKKMLESLRKPVSKYAIRVNTLKTTRAELIETLSMQIKDLSEHPTLPEALCINVKGPFSLENNYPVVIADKAAAEAVFQGANLYAPGVLKAIRVKRQGKVKIMDRRGHVVGTGVAHMDGREMMTANHGLAVEVTKSVYSTPSLRETKAFNQGLFYSQSIPAMVASRVLDPQPAETIVDLCAAPGGKTGHIAQIMNNAGEIFALDNSHVKIRKLKENLGRLGVKNVVVEQTDARYFHEDYPDVVADRVLIDPPCSALGVRPKLFDETTMKDISALINYQRQFFEPAFNTLRKNGVLVYCTCTLPLEENEEIIHYASKKYGLKIDKQPIWLGASGKDPAGLTQRFYPHLHDTPGFFIARLCKKSSGTSG